MSQTTTDPAVTPSEQQPEQKRPFYTKLSFQIVVGLIVLVFYGSLLWGLLPAPGISWQGHAFGAIGRVVAAWVIHRRPAPGPEATANSPAP